MEPPSTPHWMHVLWHTDTRWYKAELTQDLFGSWVLFLSWGSRKTRQVHTRTTCYQIWEEANREFDKVRKRRVTRGYREVTPSK